MFHRSNAVLCTLAEKVKHLSTYTLYG